MRLTAVRAEISAWAGRYHAPGDYPVRWRASRWDGKRQQRPGQPMPVVEGRLIAWRVGRGKHQQWLYLFTTLSLPAEELVALYGRRWRIETDLRSLKQTVRLQRIAVQSTDMMEKELLVAVMAYNLVRAIMFLAAQRCQNRSATVELHLCLQHRARRLSQNSGRWHGPEQQQQELDTYHRSGGPMPTPQPHQTPLLSTRGVGAWLSVFPSAKGGKLSDIGMPSCPTCRCMNSVKMIHQSLHCCSAGRTMASPGMHWKALWNSGMFRSVAMARH